MPHSTHSILHPTDFSDLSGAGLAHALRIALAARSKLHLLHIAQSDMSGVRAFPQVRRLLVQWGLAEEHDPPWVIWNNLGLEVENVTIRGQDPAQGIIGFLGQNAMDLVVFATHGRVGVERWLKGSISEVVLRRLAIPALFMTQGARGFVSQINGELKLRRVLVPVDFSPAPNEAVETIQSFCSLMSDTNIVLHLLHVGNSAPPLPAVSSNRQSLPPIMLRSGNVVEAIVNAAIEFDVDLIGMPTVGHHGVLDCLARQHDRSRDPPRAVSGPRGPRYVASLPGRSRPRSRPNPIDVWEVAGTPRSFDLCSRSRDHPFLEGDCF